MSRKRHLRCAGNICLCCCENNAQQPTVPDDRPGYVYQQPVTYAMDSHVILISSHLYVGLVLPGFSNKMLLEFSSPYVLHVSSSPFTFNLPPEYYLQTLVAMLFILSLFSLVSSKHSPQRRDLNKYFSFIARKASSVPLSILYLFIIRLFSTVLVYPVISSQMIG